MCRRSVQGTEHASAWRQHTPARRRCGRPCQVTCWHPTEKLAGLYGPAREPQKRAARATSSRLRDRGVMGALGVAVGSGCKRYYGLASNHENYVPLIWVHHKLQAVPKQDRLGSEAVCTRSWLLHQLRSQQPPTQVSRAAHGFCWRIQAFERFAGMMEAMRAGVSLKKARRGPKRPRGQQDKATTHSKPHAIFRDHLRESIVVARNRLFKGARTRSRYPVGGRNSDSCRRTRRRPCTEALDRQVPYKRDFNVNPEACGSAVSSRSCCLVPSAAAGCQC